ncbi:MAG: hypothetical protein WBV94_24760 [Blastocatellia bacterium]
MKWIIELLSGPMDWPPTWAIFLALLVGAIIGPTIGNATAKRWIKSCD